MQLTFLILPGILVIKDAPFPCLGLKQLHSTLKARHHIFTGLKSMKD